MLLAGTDLPALETGMPVSGGTGGAGLPVLRSPAGLPIAHRSSRAPTRPGQKEPPQPTGTQRVHI